MKREVRLVLALSAALLSGCAQTCHQVRNDPSAEQFAEGSVVESVEPDIPKMAGQTVQMMSGQETTGQSSPSADTITLDTLEAIAFQNNPTLAQAAARMQIAEGRQVQAGLYPNPVVGYHATEIGNRGTTGQQGGFVSQRVVTGGKLQLDKQIARREVDAAHFRFHAQEQRVLTDVRTRFYEALVAQKRVELTEELAAIGDRLVVATRTLLSSGQGTENDLLQAGIRADQSHILLDNARNEQVEAWRRLMAIVGTPRRSLTRLKGELKTVPPVYDFDSCSAAILDSHLELQAARSRSERSLLAVQRARVVPIPDVDFSVSVRRHAITDSTVANVQIGVPVPILDSNQGNISAAEAECVAAQKEVERLELELHDRLAVEFRRYENSRQQVERYRERIVPKARKSLDLVSNGYERGQVEYLTLLTAQRTYVQANLAYLDSLKELRRASVALDGQLLTGSLARRE